MNFDRLAHLVKLVFNTRIVTLSLLDGTEELVPHEFYNAHNVDISVTDFSNRNVSCAISILMMPNLIFAAGLGTQTLPRASSFNAHAILQKSVSFFCNPLAY